MEYPRIITVLNGAAAEVTYRQWRSVCWFCGLKLTHRNVSEAGVKNAAVMHATTSCPELLGLPF